MDQLSEWGFDKAVYFGAGRDQSRKINWALSGQPLSNSRRITDTRGFCSCLCGFRRKKPGFQCLSLGLLCRSTYGMCRMGFQRPACSIFCFEEKVVELSQPSSRLSGPHGEFSVTWSPENNDLGQGMAGYAGEGYDGNRIRFSNAQDRQTGAVFSLLPAFTADWLCLAQPCIWVGEECHLLTYLLLGRSANERSLEVSFPAKVEKGILNVVGVFGFLY